MVTKRKCLVCGKIYTYCKGCNTETPSWASLFDVQNCHDIFEVLSSSMPNSEKKEMLEGLDLSNLEKFDEDIKAQIKDILGYGKPIVSEFNI